MLTCHCTVGVGVPLAAAVKVTGLPAVTVWLVGWVVTTGATAAVTVSVAGWLVALPATLVKTASYSLPSSVALVVKVSVVAVAPVMSAKVTPPSVLTCHCTVGVGVPLAAAVKVTGVPAVMVWLVGSGGDDGSHGGGYRERGRLAGGTAGGVGEDGFVFAAVHP